MSFCCCRLNILNKTFTKFLQVSYFPQPSKIRSFTAMISDRFYTILRYVFLLSSGIGSIPYVWDANSHCFNKSVRCRRLIRRHTFVLTLFSITYLIQCVRFRLKGDFDTFNLMYCSFCINLLLMQIYGWMVFMEDDTYYFTNFLFNHLHYINRTLLRSKF